MPYILLSILWLLLSYLISGLSYADNAQEGLDVDGLNSESLMQAGLVSSINNKESRLDAVLISADRHQTPLRDIAASIDSVSVENLYTVQHTHINEALVRVPGTWISRGNGQENLTAIRSPVLTGAGSCGAFQLSLDNIPLRAAGLCNVNQLFEANSEQAQSIEVIRGPSSVLYGANAIHGSINVISGNTLPTLFNQDSNTSNAGSLSLDTGPHGYGRIKASAAKVLGSQGLQLNINATHDVGYKDDSGFEQQKIDVIHQFQSDNVSVTSILNASHLNQETAGYIEGFNAYKNSELKTVNNNPEAFRNASSLRLHSKIDWQKDNVTWSFVPYLRKTKMDFLMHYLPGTPLEENGQSSIGMQINHHIVSEKLEILTGLDLEVSKGFLRQTQAAVVNGTGDFLDSTLPVGKQYDFDVNVDLISPFSQLKYSIDDVNLVVAGLRVEALRYKYKNNMQSGNTAADGSNCSSGSCRYSRPNDRSDTFENVSTVVGWVHDIGEYSQSFVNLSHAFRAPQANELYRLQNDQLVADLKSEKISNLELGYRASYTDTSYTLAAYYMEKENVIFQNSSRENVSNGKTSHAGLELSGDTRLNNQLNFDFSVSYGDHKYTKNIAPRGVVELIDGNQIDTSPKLMGSARLDWAITSSQNLELEWIYLGRYYTDEANLHEYPGHELSNLRYSINMQNNWHASVRITNVFDVDYAERADYGFGKDRYFVGEPLSVYMSIGTEF